MLNIYPPTRVEDLPRPCFTRNPLQPEVELMVIAFNETEQMIAVPNPNTGTISPFPLTLLAKHGYEFTDGRLTEIALGQMGFIWHKFHA